LERSAAGALRVGGVLYMEETFMESVDLNRVVTRGGFLKSAVVFGGAVALGGCGWSGGDKKKGGPTIAWSCYSNAASRWLFEQKLMQRAVESQGGTFLAQFANFDEARERANIENFITRGADLIMITAVNGKNASGLVDTVKQADLPVIAYDIQIQDAAVDWFCSRDNVETGRIQGRAALRSAPKGNYVLVNGDPVISVALQFKQGVHEILDPEIEKGNIHVVSEQWTREWSTDRAQNQVENALTANRDDVQAVCCGNDTEAIGAVNALRGSSLAGKTFVSGNDADPNSLPLIARGQQTMSVFTRIDVMADEAIRAATALLDGKRPASDATTDVGGGHTVLTKYIPQLEINRGNLCKSLASTFPKGWANPAAVYKGMKRPAGC
jgi:D-xylose transport system substrate-binding protein